MNGEMAKRHWKWATNALNAANRDALNHDPQNAVSRPTGPPRARGDETVADRRKHVRATVPVARPPIGTPDDGRSGPGNFYTSHGT